MGDTSHRTARYASRLRHRPIIVRACPHVVKNGGTLSHHHAVGYEHGPWMRQEHSEPALRVLARVKEELDPKGIMSPGNLVGD